MTATPHLEPSVLDELRLEYPTARWYEELEQPTWSGQAWGDGSSGDGSPVAIVVGRAALPDAELLGKALVDQPDRVVVVGPEPYSTAELIAASLGARMPTAPTVVADVDDALDHLGYRPERRTAATPDSPLAHGGVFGVLDHVRASAGVSATNGWVVLRYAAGPRPSAGGVTPFASVLVRTQASPRRLISLRDTLLSLQGQTNQDFEVVVLPHNAEPERLAALASVVEESQSWFGERLRVVPVTGGGRAAPLIAGAEASRGEYVVALDDDDLVLGHWMQTFASLAAQAGRPVLLRSCAVAQQMEEVGSAVGFRASRPWAKRWDSEFDTLSQLVDNQCPIHTVALPRAELSRWNLWWDDDLPVLEDWDLLMRATQALGMMSTPEITAVYRLWPAHQNSFAHLPESDWASVRGRVLAGWDTHPFVLPPGSASRAREAELFRLLNRPIGLRARSFAARHVHEFRVAVSKTPFGPYAKRAMKGLRWIRASI